MESPPKKVDLTIFENQTLFQICIGINEIILNFEGKNFENLSITVEGTIGISSPNPRNQGSNDVQVFENLPSAAMVARDFLNESISKSEYEDGFLILHFQSGGRIEFYNDSKKFESYSIKYKGDRIVI